MSDDMPDHEAYSTGKKKSPRPTADEIERLKEMGRQRGYITLDQIKSVLPVEQMSGEEVAEAMAQLELAGIDIQIDPELLRSRTDMRSDDSWRVRQIGSKKANLVGNRSASMRSRTNNSTLARRAGASPATKKSWMNRAPMTVAVALIVAIVCALLIYASYWR
jgi:hypothetical protein